MDIKINRALARRETPLRAGRAGGVHGTKKGKKGYDRKRDKKEMERC